MTGRIFAADMKEGDCGGGVFGALPPLDGEGAEPPGPAFGRPEDRLREAGGVHNIQMQLPSSQGGDHAGRLHLLLFAIAEIGSGGNEG
jgi:hypothetical protein